MNLIIPSGAGLSYNWGGYLANEAFEYRLGAPAIDDRCRDLLWRHKQEGFDKALGVLQGYSAQSQA